MGENMYGEFLGDIIGQPYEFNNHKSKDFPLFAKNPSFTDDSILTIAVCEGLLNAGLEADENTIKNSIIDSMQKWGHKYPHAGWGRKFYLWLIMESRKPYGSFGNGSAMRVSSIGWLYDSLEKTREVARWSAEVTHNHPEGIKGAECTASAIWLARNGHSKEQIKDYVTTNFGYDLSLTCDQIRPNYKHIESCQETIPQAITAFLEGNDFEDVIRTAVSLGGDTDTLTGIAGAIAEAFYGIPENLINICREILDEEMKDVIERFHTCVSAVQGDEAGHRRL